MAIARVEQKGAWVFVYDEVGRLARTIAADDGLEGYTSSTVSIRKGDRILVYDENGRLVRQYRLDNDS